MLESLEFYFDQAWRWKCGLSKKESLSMPDYSSLLQTEKSGLFNTLRMSRKIIGAFRYGKLGDPNKAKYSRAQNMIARLEKYISDGNREHLVDVANLCELEFVEGASAGKGFEALAEHDFHTKEIL